MNFVFSSMLALGLLTAVAAYGIADPPDQGGPRDNAPRDNGARDNGARENGPPQDRPKDGPPKDGREAGPRKFHLLPPRASEELKLTSEQQRQIADLEKEVNEKLMKILTPEQQSKWNQIRPPMPPGPSQRGDRRGPPPGNSGDEKGSGQAAPRDKDTPQDGAVRRQSFRPRDEAPGDLGPPPRDFERGPRDADRRPRDFDRGGSREFGPPPREFDNGPRDFGPPPPRD